ncbi:hypothetical protein [Bradyrhizobium elkanii]|uniref:Uncharacterized protein n=1 Tax=Bradyrhizobium elkanii TaxID=29448 RepID=A0ABV4F033_BRAEL|nr:hypothetical protein [Bradyrhizobium elkanii]MCP1757793.1 hypothetical protein [Bradyrhizobium elkanii]MCS3881910.1 hypothetical protein [Bradyrhizobium elkanii]MCS4218670.1 hypothetical protein [Bradyrhizobium elkanii]MCW2110032.1 hypothetical protein [Bradyrhizobium elkanii]MCW2201597.1 hypothetical protein [Bradyrhizobium elkanii]
MAQRKDNIAFVKALMTHSKYGALAQLFVIDALSKWSDKISSVEPRAVDSPMISGEAWVGVAKEIKDKIDARVS